MPFIEIITDSKSESRLSNLITKSLVNNCEIIYIKEKNIENIKNIKLDTIVIDQQIKNIDILEKIIGNSKNVIYNLDLNKEVDKNNFRVNKVICYGYSSNSDITISSVTDEQILVCLQSTIESIYGIKIEPQEIKVSVKSDTDVYDIMIIIALSMLYAR